MAPIDYTKTCFVIMPFGTKPVGKHKVNFDRIYEEIFEPAIGAVALSEGGKLRPVRTDKEFYAGSIDEAMFRYLNQSRFALADITSLNANVMYEIGVRHAVRQSGTAIFRQGDATIPFDINHVKAFPYNYRPEQNAAAARALIRRVLRDSLEQNALDSPVQVALKAQREEPARDWIDALLLDAENALREFNRPGAIAKLREALSIGKGNALIHVRLGILLRDQGDLQAAVDQFAAATTLQPNYSDAWREKGVQEGRLKRPVEAEASLRRAIELNPSDFDALASFGGILRKAGRLDEAAAMYSKSVDVSGGHPYPLLMAIKLRARTSGTLVFDDTVRRQLFLAGKMREAQAAANPPIDAPWSMFDIAEIRLFAGNRDLCLDWVKKGLKTSTHKWEPQTFKSALELLGGVAGEPVGLQEVFPLLNAAIDELP